MLDDSVDTFFAAQSKSLDNADFAAAEVKVALMNTPVDLATGLQCESVAVSCASRARADLPITWHGRRGGSVAADDTGRILGEVRTVSDGRYFALQGMTTLGEYITLESAHRAVEVALAGARVV